MYAQDCEQLTLFPADSPANHSVWLESKKVGTMSAIFGLRCSELSENLRRVGSSVRTYLESCELPPGTWSRVWSAKVMTSRCLILKLRLSERRTDGKGSRLWPTPGALDSDRGTLATEEALRKRLENGHQLILTDLVKFQDMWPTPRAKEDCDYQYSGGRRDHKTLTLQGMVKLCPTPAASDCRGEIQDREKNAAYGWKHCVLLKSWVLMYQTPRAQSANGQADQPNRQGGPDLQSVAGGQLNPTWVEWLMGYPIGWTESDVSETP